MTDDTVNFWLETGTVPVYELEVDGPECYDVSLDTKIVVETLPGDVYEGPYIVDPKFTEQTLETKHKTMADDVTVNAIMVSSVSNPTGGNTVYIGGIVDYA